MWESKIRLFGMPLLSVGFFARGFIAIGWSGVGVICIAQFGAGFIAITQFGVGIFALSQFTVGFFTIAQFSVGIIAAIGLKAIGFAALGGSTNGFYTLGGIGFKDIYPGIFLVKDMIAANPLPFTLWSGAWGAMLLYAFMRRRVITFPMSPFDFFRPLIHHSNVLIRLMALGKLEDQHELAAVVQTDPSPRVRAQAINMLTDQNLLKVFTDTKYDSSLRTLAIAKIEDRGFLASLAVKEPNQTVAETLINHIHDEGLLLDVVERSHYLWIKLLALKTMKNPNRARMAELAKRETDTQVFQLMADFLDDAVLMDIAQSTSAMSIAEAAIERIRKPDEEFLYRFAVDEKHAVIADAAVNRITSGPIIEKILKSRAHQNARIAALHRCDNKDLILKISQSGESDNIKKIAQKRLQEITPLYYSLKLEIHCPNCSQPVFVNGPAQKVKCNTCLSMITLSSGFWKNAAAAPAGVTRILQLNNLTVEKMSRDPLCRSCGAELDVDDVPAGTSGSVKCPGCGESHSAIPLPKWFAWSKNAEQIFCADTDGQEREDAKKKIEMSPVAVSCIKCGGPLDITAETPRNATCTYCKTVQYLPDQLWLSIHPVKVKRPWYIRCNYREKEIYFKLNSRTES